VTSRIILACLFFVLAVFAPAPRARAQNLFSGLAIDGIRCEASEGVAEHLHTDLQLFGRGRSVEIPAGIGMPAGANCLYWLHTHNSDGIVHIESPVVRTFTLGDFFDIWGEPLSRTEAAQLKAPRGAALLITVNGKRWTRDPRSIPLRDREQIVIQNGPPYERPKRVDWSNL
jgi:hypothetical protein